MVQIYKKILRGEGNRGKKKASPPTPSPKGEGECWEQFAWERLNSFSNHRGITHSTPLPMGEGLGVGPVAFVTYHSPLHSERGWG